MAYVSIHKDLSAVKSKLALNMTKRQLICFGTAVVIGIPTYVFTRQTIGNSAAVLIMIGLMLPFFFLAMYEKDGRPAEILLRNYIKARFWSSGIRPYATENFYESIQKEAKIIAAESKTTTKAVSRKYSTGKNQEKRVKR